MEARATVMVVDDNDALRRTMVRALTRAGFEVLEAPSGPVALEIAATTVSRPMLLVTDVDMPGMDGPELAAQLTTRNSGLRVLFTSGCDGPAGRAFLAKPFGPSDLVTRVRAILHGL